MINVIYSRSVENNILPEILRRSEDRIFSKIKSINILSEEDYEEDTVLGEEQEKDWTIKTHYMGKGTKSKRAIYQIAFEPILEKNEKLEDFYLRVRPGSNSKSIDYLRYCERSNLFFYSEPKKNNKEKNSSVANTAGRFFVEVVDLKSNCTLKRINILVKPSSLTYDDYLKMIRELREIREDIIINNNSKVSLGQRYINKKKTIEEVVDELEIALNSINKRPKSKLKAEYIKKKYNQINKITNKTLIEKSIYPYKNSFTAINYEESLDIYENRLLKQVLINLKEKIKEYKEFYNDYIEAEKKDLYDAKKRFESITKKSFDEILTYKRNIEDEIKKASESESLKKYFNHKGNEESYEILESLDRKSKDIKLLMSSFEAENSWEILENKIDKLLRLDIFKEIKNKEIHSIKPTQIFINDNSYRKAYKAIKNCNNKISILSMESTESILVKATCDIYEIWCVFKIAQLLIIKQRWTLLNNEEVLKDLDKFLKVKDSYTEKKVEFKFTKSLNAKRKIDLSLVYEGRVYYNNDKYKTPDYQFIYEVKNEKNEVINTMRAYLDAKYRDYFSQGAEVYYKDIKNVAIEKYIETFENTENKATCSMIVHSYKNDSFVNWGADCYERENFSERIKLSPHGYGAFYLVPSDTSNLSKFLRLLPEYHLNFRDNFNIDNVFEFSGYDICWECGETKEISKETRYTKGSIKKYYYTCKNCNEFWVKSHCESNQRHKLIKHRNNYHLLNNEKNNPWHLICPECGNGGNFRNANFSNPHITIESVSFISSKSNVIKNIPIDERIPF